MTDTKYNKSITAISVFAAVVLVIGCLLSVFTSTPEDRENEPVQNAPVYQFASVIDTSTPESYDSLMTNMLKLRNEYPHSLKLFTAGYSESGKEILMFTMGNGEKKALVIGGIHAREHITTKYLLRVIEDYCFQNEKGTGIYGNFNIKELLCEYTLYIIPCVNPDGLEIISGRMNANKNVRITDIKEYKANLNGVDINRNFPLAWEYIVNGVNSPYTHFFKGYESGSESETKTLMTLCEENSFEFALSIHIKGNCIFWGDTFNTNFNGLYKAFAEDIAFASGLSMTEPTLKPTDYGGGFENWFRHTYNRPGVCIELSHYTNIISPCDNKNYTDFDSFVNYSQSKYALAAAMASNNK